MKKKKILLGLTLAAASLAALVSCGSSKDDKTSKPQTQETGPKTGEKTGVTGEKSTGEKSTGNQSTGNKSTAPVDETIEFTIHYCVKNGDELANTNTVTYDDETKTLAEAVGEPATISGYKPTGVLSYNKKGNLLLDGTKTLAENLQLQDFVDEEIEEITDIYVFYEELTIYDTYAASPNKVLAYDFNDSTDLASYPLVTDTTTTYIEGSTGSANIANGKLVVVANAPEGSQKNDGQATVAVDTGEAKIVKGTFKLSTSITNSLMFLNFVGADEKTEKIQIGAAPALRYTTADGGKMADSTVSISANTEYLFEFTLDYINQAITITVDGNATAVTSLPMNIVNLKALQFGSSKGAAAEVKVDNIAIITDDSLDSYKEVSKAYLNARYAEYKAADYRAEIYTNITTAKDNGLTAINAATDAAGCKAAITTALAAMKAEPTLVDDAKTEKITLVEAWINDAKVDDDNRADVEEVINNAKTAINACTTVAQVTAAYQDALSKFEFATAEKIVVTFYYEGGTTETQKVANGKTINVANLTSIPSGKKIAGLYSDDTYGTAFAATTAITAATPVYVKLTDVTTNDITAFDASAANYNGWTVVSGNSVGIHPTVGTAVKKSSEVADGDEYVVCPTIAGTAADEYVLSTAYANSIKANLTMICATNGTNNPCNVLVEFLVKEGTEYKVVDSALWEGVTDKKTTTTNTKEFTSKAAFNYIRISFSELSNTAGKNVGILSITGTVTDAQY